MSRTSVKDGGKKKHSSRKSKHKLLGSSEHSWVGWTYVRKI